MDKAFKLRIELRRLDVAEHLRNKRYLAAAAIIAKPENVQRIADMLASETAAPWIEKMLSQPPGFKVHANDAAKQLAEWMLREWG